MSLDLKLFTLLVVVVYLIFRLKNSAESELFISKFAIAFLVGFTIVNEVISMIYQLTH
ncbi:hypothetical protein [Streptococcus sp. sy010]|uniref:hypothetical protein n=1 Tax=Streptococcus sp. sy010 TaxID=2600148 RepID=UPI001646FF6A|nr:hypothetical protein [Streptococcus sp. sy010]